MEKYSGLHSTCKEVKEQSPDEVRNRALSGALRHVVDKGSRKLERPSVKGQVTDRHVLGMGTDVSRFKKKVSGQVHENQFRRV